MDLGPVNLSDPVNRSLGVMKGLKAWWGSVPGATRPLVLRDITRPAAGHHGTITNIAAHSVAGAGWDAGPDGLPVLQLNGFSADYVVLPSGIDSFPTDRATLAVWCRFRVATPAAIGQTGFCRLTTTSNLNQSGHYPYTDGSGYFNTFLNSRVGPITLSSAVTRTRWHLVTVTSSPGASNWKLYQNDILLTSQTGQATINLDEANGIWLGRSDNPGAGSAPFHMDGWIGGALLWERDLSAAEVKAVYQEFAAGLPTFLNRRRVRGRVPAVPPAGGGFRPQLAVPSNKFLTRGRAG